jgi:hypothetical protein
MSRLRDAVDVVRLERRAVVAPPRGQPVQLPVVEMTFASHNVAMLPRPQLARDFDLTVGFVVEKLPVHPLASLAVKDNFPLRYTWRAWAFNRGMLILGPGKLARTRFACGAGGVHGTAARFMSSLPPYVD